MRRRDEGIGSAGRPVVPRIEAIRCTRASPASESPRARRTSANAIYRANSARQARRTPQDSPRAKSILNSRGSLSAFRRAGPVQSWPSSRLAQFRAGPGSQDSPRAPAKALKFLGRTRRVQNRLTSWLARVLELTEFQSSPSFRARRVSELAEFQSSPSLKALSEPEPSERSLRVLRARRAAGPPASSTAASR